MSEYQPTTPGEAEPPAEPRLPPVASPTSSSDSAYRFPQPPPPAPLAPPTAPSGAAQAQAPAAPPTASPELALPPTTAVPPTAQSYPPTAQSYPTTAQPYPTTGQPYSGGAPAYPTTGQPYPGGAPYQPAQPYPGMPPTFPPAASSPAGGGQPRPTRRGALLGAGALAVALAGGLVGGFVGHSLQPATSNSSLQIPGLTGNGQAAPQIDRSSLSTIAAGLQPAIVHIANDEGEGSGVVVSADGNIVTNNHVVAGFRTVTVTFNSGQQVTGQVVGTDERTDIGVVKVDASNLIFASWGDSDAVQVGDTVLAMGSPLGLQGSVTAGIVSGLHRTISAGSSQRSDTSGGTTIGDAIQTDAPINPGNSGGALVSMSGEVIGINTAIATAGSNGNIGVGFAISSNRAKAIAESIIAGRPVGHPFLGVKVSSAPGGGAKIESVDSGSAAAQAGIQEGDVITKWGDRDIHTMEDLIGAIQASTVGQQVHVTLTRGGAPQTVTVTVAEQ